MSKEVLNNTPLPPYHPHRRTVSGPAVLLYPPEELAEPELDLLGHAKRVNCFMQLALALLVVVFNAVFWTMALNEYLLPPEYYLDKQTQA